MIGKNMATSKLDYALALAKLGFHVFPIVEGKKAPPRMEGWQRFATREPNKIADMWRAHPNDNIGISTSKFGDRGALVVVDVDNKNGKDGDGQLFELELGGFDLGTTLESRTPTGGRHLFFTSDSPLKQGLTCLHPAWIFEVKAVTSLAPDPQSGEWRMNLSVEGQPSPQLLSGLSSDAESRPSEKSAPSDLPAPPRSPH